MSQSPDPFEFLKSLWGPMGLPAAGMNAPLRAAEIDRRIAELKSVEGWLDMNLNVLRMTIQGLEMQKAGLTPVQGEGTATPAAAAPNRSAGAFAEAWLNALQQQAPPGRKDPTPK